jgi:trehalose synthase
VVGIPSSEHERYDLWWKTAVFYCLDVECFLDSDGDGIGDFHGLLERVDYLVALGVNCIWLMPFYPTPNRDDGYDITDFYGVDPRLGDLGDFTRFVEAARERGMRVIVDLVINHTSIEHPWFQAARAGPDSEFHDYYVWQDERPEDWETSLVFPGEQTENWTYDRKARRYYLHHFYEHQPDLNPSSPKVHEEMKQVMSFWVQLGVSGFRVDAVPFLIDMKGIDTQREMLPHEFLRDLAAYLDRRRGNAIMLGEVNLPPHDAVEYMGEGDELEMLFNFNVNQYLYLALARRDADPLRKALDALPTIPGECQWAHFLKNHDELTLDQLTEAERREVFEAFGPDPDMQIFDRGIRRRLPPMLGGDRARLRLAYSVLFSLPGTPVLFYGEELGMGENLDIPGRAAVRSPMQWADDAGAGFSVAPADALRRPITKGRFGPGSVNAAAQIRDPDSMLSWMKELIDRHRSIPEFGMGAHSTLDLGVPEVLAQRSEWRDGVVVTLHNFSDRALEVSIEAESGERRPVEMWSDRDYGDIVPEGVKIEGDGYRWFRLLAPGERTLA